MLQFPPFKLADLISKLHWRAHTHTQIHLQPQTQISIPFCTVWLGLCLPSPLWSKKKPKHKTKQRDCLGSQKSETTGGRMRICWAGDVSRMKNHLKLDMQLRGGMQSGHPLSGGAGTQAVLMWCITNKIDRWWDFQLFCIFQLWLKCWHFKDSFVQNTMPILGCFFSKLHTGGWSSVDEFWFWFLSAAWLACRGISFHFDTEASEKFKAPSVKSAA